MFFYLKFKFFDDTEVSLKKLNTHDIRHLAINYWDDQAFSLINGSLSEAVLIFA